MQNENVMTLEMRQVYTEAVQQIPHAHVAETYLSLGYEPAIKETLGDFIRRCVQQDCDDGRDSLVFKDPFELRWQQVVCEQLNTKLDSPNLGPQDDKMIKVLDHGYVRLIDHMGSDLNIIRAARNSYDAAWRAGENTGSDERLMRYLWNNGHTTPFEAVTVSFDIKAPIFVFRQWHRHRTWSYNEVSARYVELPTEFYLPEPHLIGKQSESSKQARNILSEMTNEELKVARAGVETAKISMENSFEIYRTLLNTGWPKELARSVLPVATYSRMFATVNLLNLLKFLSLRMHPHAQYEIRVYAEAMLELFRPICPVAIAAWEEAEEKKRK